MTPEVLLADLRARGVTVEAHGSQLHCRPRSRLTDEDLAALRDNKPALLQILTAPGPCSRVACFSCKSSVFWQSIHGAIVCGVCHAPGSDALVERWMETDAG